MNDNPNAPYVIARILGPLLLIAGAALFAQAPRMLGVIDMALESTGTTIMLGFLAFAIGFSILAFSSSWRGLTEILVTLVGYLSILRGALFVFAPGLAHSMGVFLINNPIFLPIAGGVFALVGLWLCFAGFFTTHVPENEQLVEHLK